MKKLVLILFLVLSASIACAQETKTTAAVMDLDPSGVDAVTASVLSDYLRTMLVNTQKFALVTSEDMGSILKEHQVQIQGCISQECIIQMGQLLGVRKIFTGSINKSGSTYLITLNLFDAGSGSVEKSIKEECANCEADVLVLSIENVAQKAAKAVQVAEAKKPVPEPIKTGSCEIVTTPDSANVYIDGELRGASPLSIADLPTGIHKAKITKDGYKNIDLEFKIVAGRITDKSYSLEKQEEVQVKPSKIITNRFGIGINWPGVQFRYCINDSILAEAKIQFSATNILLGGRGYFLLNEIQWSYPLIPYVGGEFDWSLSPYLQGGFMTGGFIGIEALFTENVGIGGDAGLYYVNLWSSLGSIDDWGLIFNAGLTYYF